MRLPHNDNAMFVLGMAAGAMATVTWDPDLWPPLAGMVPACVCAFVVLFLRSRWE